MHREPLVFPSTALAIGILVGHFLYFRLSDLLFPALLAGLAIGLAFGVQSARRMRVVSVYVGLLLAGIATQVIHRQGPAPKLTAEDGETVLLTGCVTDPAVFSPTREQFTLELAPQASARISAFLKDGERLRLPYGQRVEVAAKVRVPRNFQNPNSFDYAGYLARQHIYWTGSISHLADIHVLPGRCGFRPAGWLYAIRTWALERLSKLYPADPQTSGLLQATLIGDSSNVDRRWTNDFRLTGTYHALVISGQHVSVLALTVLLIFRLLRLRRVPALALATFASWIYAFISGFSAPVVRAAGGFTLFLGASYCFRRIRILNTLAAVAIFYLTFDPGNLFDASFQLSFLAAAAIAAFALPVMERLTEPLRRAVQQFDRDSHDPQIPPRAAQWRVELRLLAETVRIWTRIPERAARFLVSKGALVWVFVAEGAIVCACVQFGLALPMIGYFHRLSITSVSANIVVIPLLSAVVPLGFAAILTGWHPLAAATKVLLDWAVAVAAWHARFEPAWRIASLPLWISVTFGISLVWLAIAIGRRSQRLPALTCSLALFGVICLQPWEPEIRPHMLELTAIDVSQGDSLLLVFPDGETMLVDAGGFPGMGRMRRKPKLDIGEDVVSPYLWSRRIQHLDYAVLTHGHSDHMGGLPAILDNFKPRILWIGVEPDTTEWENVERHAAEDHVRIVALNRASPAIEIGGARLRILAPSVDYVEGEAPENNDSLVLEVTYGRRSILLAGDAERSVEDDMITSGELHPITLLKVGHHGSRTSSSKEFLDAVDPHLALISDGYKNQFHHPNPDVLKRLAEHHAAVFRTDQRGLITFRTDGDKIELQTFQ